MRNSVTALDIALKTSGSVRWVPQKLPILSAMNIPMTGALVVGSFAVNAAYNHLLSTSDSSVLAKGQLVRNQAIYQGKKTAFEIQTSNNSLLELNLVQKISNA